MNLPAAALALLVATAAQAQAQPVAADFPGDATTPNAGEIQAALADKVFAVQVADGSSWRLEYKSNGYWFVNTSRGFSDTGKWHTEDGKLCAGGRRIKDGCNDVRTVGTRFFYKRDSGEIVEFKAK